MDSLFFFLRRSVKSVFFSRVKKEEKLCRRAVELRLLKITRLLI